MCVATRPFRRSGHIVNNTYVRLYMLTWHSRSKLDIRCHIGFFHSAALLAIEDSLATQRMSRDIVEDICECLPMLTWHIRTNMDSRCHTGSVTGIRRLSCDATVRNVS